LREACVSSETGLQIVCKIYIAGATDALEQESPAPFCEPSGNDRTQLSIAFLYYIGRHPDEVDQPAPLLVKRALEAAYPCRKAGAR